MGKSKRVKRYDETDEERQERILTQLQRAGRAPTAPPGFFHDTGERQNRRRDRKAERVRLRHYENVEEEDELAAIDEALIKSIDEDYGDYE